MAIKVANNQSMTGITALPSAISGGAWTLISTTTASSSATVSITSGLDDTYDVYCFKFINIHPATDSQTWQVNFSSDTGSNYNVTKTTTYFRAYHYESGSSPTLGYDTGEDIAQGTGFQTIGYGVGSDNDQSISGYMYLYAPSDTTYVKHFLIRASAVHAGDIAFDHYTSGYCNTTSAVDAVQFKFGSGDVDAGIVTLYGIN